MAWRDVASGQEQQQQQRRRRQRLEEGEQEEQEEIRPSGIAALAAKVKDQQGQQPKQQQKQQAKRSPPPQQAWAQQPTAAPPMQIRQIQANTERLREQQQQKAQQTADDQLPKTTPAPQPKTAKPRAAAKQTQQPSRRRGRKGPKEPPRPMVVLPAGMDLTTRPTAILSAKREAAPGTSNSPPAPSTSPATPTASKETSASKPKKQGKAKASPANASAATGTKAKTPPLVSPKSAPTPPPPKSPYVHELVDARFNFVSAAASLPAGLWQAANLQYRVIGVIGTPGSGKSAVLNVLTASTASLNPAERENPFAERTAAERHGIVHKTRGVNAAFCTVGGERVLLLDAQPVLSPSVLYDLVERQANLNLCSSHASLATLHDLRLAVFMLSVCDAVLVVEDGDQESQARALWKLLRFAYLAKSGDAVDDQVADLILVRNKMTAAKLEVASALAREQEAWTSFFADIVPYAAPHPQLFFCPLGTYGLGSIDAASPEVLFLKHVLLYEVFASDKAPEVLATLRGTPSLSAPAQHHADQLWWHAAAFPPDEAYLSFSDEENGDDADDNDDSETDYPHDDIQDVEDESAIASPMRVSQTKAGAGLTSEHDEWEACHDAGDGFAHLHTLLAMRRVKQRSDQAEQLLKTRPPMSEAEWVDRAARLWARDIPHSIQLREFAVVCDGLLLSS